MTSNELIERLMELFPGHIIQNEIPLYSLAGFNKVKNLLYKEDFDLFMKSKIDYVISDRFTKKPIMCINLADNYYYSNLQVKKSALINRVLEMLRIPLVELEHNFSPGDLTILPFYTYLQNVN